MSATANAYAMRQMWVAKWFAKKNAGRFRVIPRRDLLELCRIGVIRAARKGGPTRGAKFSSYAVLFMRQAISEELGHWFPISLPRHVARAPKMFPSRAADREKAAGAQRLYSLPGWQETVPFGEDIGSQHMATEELLALRSAISRLSPRDQYLTRLLWGIGCEQHTHKEAAEILGIARQNVSKRWKHIEAELRGMLVG